MPPHSQRLHVGTFPEWDNGGESWCSPTSTTMLLEHWGRGPTAEESGWVGDAVDPEVVHGVRRVYDPAFRGAGNWAFNTAYAATRGLRSYVTRLRDLTEAERFVAAGIPLVVSVTFRRDELDGAGYDTNGHLLTIVGFTADGDVVSNDPNSHTDREQRPGAHGLPARPVRARLARRRRRAGLRDGASVTSSSLSRPRAELALTRRSAVRPTAGTQISRRLDPIGERGC